MIKIARYFPITHFTPDLEDFKFDNGFLVCEYALKGKLRRTFVTEHEWVEWVNSKIETVQIFDYAKEDVADIEIPYTRLIKEQGPDIEMVSEFMQDRVNALLDPKTIIGYTNQIQEQAYEN